MNSIDVRTEKANANFKYGNIQRFTTLFRFMEICIFIVFISTFSLQFPSIRISVDQFKEISFTGFSPKFVFVIGNVIILILLFKSRVTENEDQIGTINVYDDYVKRCENNAVNRTICRTQSEKKIEVKCKDSESHRKLTPEICRTQSEKKIEVKCKDSEIYRKLTPEICRTQSEKIMTVECTDGESHRKLRRSVTERKVLNLSPEKMMTVGFKDGESGVVKSGGETAAPESCGVEGLSSEAFRRTVEAFIARQQRSLRDEELAPVPYVAA
ncbi:hypothetical protein QVD17_05692 [Tagetes erecta]|uniref:Uncharacterized protein n=1 Tax=Tagetes erecta TaxID=13708 RepID=A0AAD8LM16_TARER|nr:hypothetical protein QVD17_05692 [Tagetes erecta]